MIISKPAIIFHTSQIFFNFLAMACFASVASFQAKWGIGPCEFLPHHFPSNQPTPSTNRSSRHPTLPHFPIPHNASSCTPFNSIVLTRFNVAGLSGFAIFVSVSGIFLSLFMLCVPVVYEKYDKFTRLARALKEIRVGFILVGSGSIFSLLIACVITSPTVDLVLTPGQIYHDNISLDRTRVQKCGQRPSRKPWRFI